MGFKTLAYLATLALSASAAVIDPANLEKRASCPSYTIINTRGTGEPQGESSGFRTMNNNIQRQLSGGKIYNTVYAAGFSQNSAAGTQDIINKVQSTLRTNPNECFILEGYSQGAAATVDALPQLTGASFDAVKGVFLIGDPDHKSGLACNVDNNGGTTTRNVNGLSAFGSRGIPSNWISKTRDVCIYGDGVCDTTHGSGINAQHLQYPRDTPTQNLGTKFITQQLS
ncbi:carbohydrate esterase family 5 protein [Hortaea werneckii]|nr:carbohydrate esterase family 5 protein [Hortaea werneckii]